MRLMRRRVDGSKEGHRDSLEACSPPPGSPKPLSCETEPEGREAGGKPSHAAGSLEPPRPLPELVLLSSPVTLRLASPLRASPAFQGALVTLLN